MPDIWQLFRYCNKRIPLRDLVQAIAQAVGVEIPSDKPAQYMTGDALKALVDSTGGRVEGIASLHG